MNTAYIHLLLNHVAILAAIFSVVILAWGYYQKDKSIRSVALSGFILSAIAAIPVFLTGEGAEELVENVNGVSKSMIESHEESANVALWLTEIVGGISVLFLVAERFQWKAIIKLYAILLVLALVMGGAIGYTGYAGGKIHHTEIYSSSDNNSSSIASPDQPHDED